MIENPSPISPPVHGNGLQCKQKEKARTSAPLLKGELAEDRLLERMVKEGRVDRCGIVLGFYPRQMASDNIAEKIKNHLERPRALEIEGRHVTIAYTINELIRSVSLPHLYRNRFFPGYKMFYIEIAGSSVVPEFLIDEIKNLWKWVQKYIDSSVRERLSKKREDVDHRLFVNELDERGRIPHTTKMIHCLQRKAEKIDPSVSIFYEGLVKKGGTREEDPDKQLMIGVEDRISGIVQEFICIYGDLYNSYLSTDDNLRIGCVLGGSIKPVVIADEHKGPQALICQILNLFHLPHPEKLDVRALKKVLLKQMKGKRLFPISPEKETGEKALFEKALKNPLFPALLKKQFNNSSYASNLVLLGLIAVKLSQYGLLRDHQSFLTEIGGEFLDKDPEDLVGVPRLIDRLNRNGRMADLPHILNIHAYIYDARRQKTAPFLSSAGHSVCLTHNAQENIWKISCGSGALFLPFHPESSLIYLEEDPEAFPYFLDFPFAGFDYQPISEKKRFEEMKKRALAVQPYAPDLSFLFLMSVCSFSEMAKHLFDLLQRTEHRDWMLESMVRQRTISGGVKKKIAKIFHRKSPEGRLNYLLAMELFSREFPKTALELLYRVPFSHRIGFGGRHFPYLFRYSLPEALKEVQSYLSHSGAEKLKLQVMEEIFPYLKKLLPEELEGLIELLAANARSSKSQSALFVQWINKIATLAPTLKMLKILEELTEDKRIKKEQLLASIEAVWCRLFEDRPERRHELIILAEHLKIDAEYPRILRRIFDDCLFQADLPRQKQIIRAVTTTKIDASDIDKILNWYRNRIEKEGPKALWEEVRAQNYFTQKEKNSLLIDIYRNRPPGIVFFSEVEPGLCNKEELLAIQTEHSLAGIERFDHANPAFMNLLHILKLQGKCSDDRVSSYLSKKLFYALGEKNQRDALTFLSFLNISSQEVLVQMVDIGSFGFAKKALKNALSGSPFETDDFLNQVFWNPLQNQRDKEVAEGMAENLSFYREFAPFLIEHFLSGYFHHRERHTAEIHLISLFILHQQPCRSENLWRSFANTLFMELFTENEKGTEFAHALWPIVLKELQTGGFITKNIELFALLYLNALFLIREIAPREILKVLDLTLLKDYAGLLDHPEMYCKFLRLTFQSILKSFKTFETSVDKLLLMDRTHKKVEGPILYPAKDLENMKKVFELPDNKKYLLVFQGACIEFQFGFYCERLKTAVHLEDRKEIDRSLTELFEIVKAVSFWSSEEIFEILDLVLSIPEFQGDKILIIPYLIYQYCEGCRQSGEWPMPKVLFKALRHCHFNSLTMINGKKVHFIRLSFEILERFLQSPAPLDKGIRLQAALLLSLLIEKFPKQCEPHIVKLMKNRDFISRHSEFFDLPYLTLFKGRFPTRINGILYEYNFGIYFYWQYRNEIDFPTRFIEKFLNECLNAPKIYHTQEKVGEVFQVAKGALEMNEGEEGAVRLIRILIQAKNRNSTARICLEEIASFKEKNREKAFELLAEYLAKVPISLPIEEEKTVHAVNRTLKEKGIQHQMVPLSGMVKHLPTNSLASICMEWIEGLEMKEREQLMGDLIDHPSFHSFIWLVNLFKKFRHAPLLLVNMAVHAFISRYETCKNEKLCLKRLHILGVLFDMHIRSYLSSPSLERFGYFSHFVQTIQAAEELIKGGCVEKWKSDPFLFECFRYIFHLRQVSITLNGPPLRLMGEAVASLLETAISNMSDQAVLDPRNIRILMNYVLYSEEKELNKRFQAIYLAYLNRIGDHDLSDQKKIAHEIALHIANVRANVYYKVENSDYPFKVMNTLQELNREAKIAELILGRPH